MKKSFFSYCKSKFIERLDFSIHEKHHACWHLVLCHIKLQKPSISTQIKKIVLETNQFLYVCSAYGHNQCLNEINLEVRIFEF